jgi:hypothetical protein
MRIVFENAFVDNNFLPKNSLQIILIILMMRMRL